MKRITTVLLLLSMTAGLSGCAAMFDGVVSCETEIRNCVLAQKAWGHWSWCYGDLDFPFHFAKGFKDGYKNVLEGGSGCQPTLPPQCYWKPCYQTPEGHCKIHAWFDGFSHGVLAAKQDGYGAMGEIPISPTARQNLELNRTPRSENMFYATEYANGQQEMGTLDGGLVPPMAPTDAGVELPVDGVDTQLTPVLPYE